ncbi:amidohydrolase family protein [Mycolicibacterium diernhoferi]|uniref:Amidohydrolase n=1 Tax=Mycolicibacterium diernhoferi TaxID=1801 RepID=A0A1Q4HHC6_9MYCO|nr:amidohydrolase family protein [Mycolicibacterium diernhoferi]OJZ66930.1 amidohydrolase [Mycolicibacterium diernhoferi]OPE55632.1 amidohydrolase [Mycolicibacterium diernhoferi]PEG51374.1 amidohydrolase [Mycolicibacterium diernhoferi]QYL23118.1 amidohydrolase family protein [Mycolicibacterium diernhoferi]
MLIRRAMLLDGRSVDIRTGAQITEVASDLEPQPEESVLDAAGGTVIPGLHDHHVHVHSAAAAADSLRVGVAEVGDRDDLARALAGAQVGADGWIRAVGYHESVAGPLDRHRLDTLAPSVPVRIQHRSGILWTLNSAGLAAVGLADHPDGRLRSADRTWSDALARRATALDELSNRLSGYGVTGLTDATPNLDIADIVKLEEAHRQGGLQQRVHHLAPGKRILHDESLDLDELIDWTVRRHRDNAPVAVHCVTAAQLVITIAALRAAGTHPDDRIEHAAVVPDDCVAEIAALGVTVVTQPNFVAERGDQYLTDVPADEHPQLWRLASLLDAGIPVALSTDMPFGEGDPWAAMRAAVHRRTPGGAVLGAAERVDARTALDLFLGTATQPAVPRTVAEGQPGDLCVLEVTPERLLRDLDGRAVVATVIDGQVAYRRTA